MNAKSRNQYQRNDKRIGNIRKLEELAELWRRGWPLWQFGIIQLSPAYWAL